MQEESNKKRIAKNTAFLYGRMLVVMAVSFFTSRIVLQSLGETNYGIYDVVGGVVTMMSFINGALSSSTSRFLTYELGKKNIESLSATFSASLNLHLAVSILVIIVGETVGVWFLYNKMTIPEEQLNAAFWILQFSIITTCINFTQIPFNASIISHENMSIFAYVGLYEAFSKLGIAYFIQLNHGHRLILYGLLLMVNTVLILSFYRFYTYRHYTECRFRLIKDFSLYRKLINYSGWDLFGNFGSVCQNQGMNIILNIFFGPAVNAARAVAFQIQNSLKGFIMNFLVAARPRVVKYFAEEKYTAMFKLTFYSCKISYFLMLGLMLPVAYEINFILKIWLGDAVPQYTPIFTLIVFLIALSDSIHLAFLMAYHAVGKIKWGNLIGGGLMILSLPVGYFALRLGAPPYSVFIIILILNFIAHTFCWVLLHRELSFSYSSLIKTVYLPCIIVTLISIIVPSIIVISMPNNWLRFIILIIFSEMTFISVAYLFGFNSEEKKELISPILSQIKLKLGIK